MEIALISHEISYEKKFDKIQKVQNFFGIIYEQN